MDPKKFIEAITLLIISVILLSCAPRVAPISEYAAISFDPRQLIAPSDIYVQSSLKTILADQNDVRTDFRRIQDWVAANVEYVSDVSAYWQMPSETLTKKKGDCKDFSTLLCTLWRAYGIPAGDVYVAIGKSNDDKRHAFVIEKYLKGKWQVIEPQVGGFIASDLSAAETAEKYEITFLFNDIEYSGEPVWIYQRVRGINAAAASTAKTNEKKPLPVINSFIADPPNIYAGKSTTLSWVVDGSTYVGIDQGIGGVDPVGTTVVSPIDTTEYKLVALNDSGSVTSALTIKVTPFTSTPRPSQSVITFQDDTQVPFSIGFTGWYTGNEKVSTVNAGQPVTTRINMKGGSPGQCIMRVWRAITTGHDEIVAQWGFIHDGNSTTQQLSFAPSYAIGESGTQGYYVDLVKDSEQVWIMPNAYPPRLTVGPKPGFGPLTVSFAGWYVGVNSVYTAKKDQPVSTGITLTGGSEGQYTLHVRRDVAGSDQSVQQITFNYDGTSAIQELIFSPPYATEESGTRGYYLDLYKDGKFVWSLSGNYPPRLTVTP